MEFAFGNFLSESSWSDNMFAPQTIQRCPFLRNINEPTNFSLSSVNLTSPVRGVKGPIFEDGPNFEMAFRFFHGQDGVVPLSGRSYIHNESVEPKHAPQFNPLAAKAATISLSSFGFGGPFGFDFFSKKLKKKSSKHEPTSEKGAKSAHEALGNEWLETGQCPIAKSFRAVKFVVPLVAKALQPPPGMKFKCPPAIVAARAALARTALVKDLRPQPLPAKMLSIALLGMAANVPLGVWREHTTKFSPQWFAAIHAAVPFIAMLRKAVLMPKAAMVFTIAASILGQTIGSRAERLRLKAVAARSSGGGGGGVANGQAVAARYSGGGGGVANEQAVAARYSGGGVANEQAVAARYSGGGGGVANGRCSEERIWDAVKTGGVGSPSASVPKASVCC